MHFLENSMFVLNAYFCRELRFVAILRSKLRFLLRNTGVDSEFLRKKLAVEGSGQDLNVTNKILKMNFLKDYKSTQR